MQSSFKIVRSVGDEDRAELGRLIATTFRMGQPDGWIDRVDPAVVRAVYKDGRLVAGFFLHDFHQWFGGRPVRMGGIGAVAVAPAARGGGVGGFLIRAALDEIRESGAPISTLYPATQPLYRRAGYELAGTRFSIEIPTDGLSHRDRTLEVRPFGPDDQDRARKIYEGVARWRPGYIGRSPMLWERAFSGRRGTDTESYVIAKGDEVLGYVSCTVGGEGLEQTLHLNDFVTTTPEAGRRLLAFLADHQSLIKKVTWFGSPTDPVLYLLREQSYKIRVAFHWMVRLVDLPVALSARGYPAGTHGRLELEVRDDHFPGNAGRFVLEVADGTGRCVPGGSGAFRTDIRGLAAIYTGHASPADMLAAGYVDTDETSSRTAEALFSGPAPCMADMF